MQLTEGPTSLQACLSYIDFRLFFIGKVSAAQLVERFDIELQEAQSHLVQYCQLAANNAQPQGSDCLVQSGTFKPVFTHDPRKTLVKFSNEISEITDVISEAGQYFTSPSLLNVPDIQVVARLVQAIHNRQVVSVIYTSLSSGSAARELVPHAIVDNGLRWHVRAYDRKSKSFRDFVLTRISKVTIKASSVSEHELNEHDHQWNRQVSLKLVPHPQNVSQPTAIEMDYGMIEGELTIKIRSALAGYVLRRWNVDCTKNGCLKGPEFQLFLKNRHTLFGAENLAIAPGYDLAEDRNYF